MERLGDQERRFGTLAGQEAFGVCGDEHHRHFEGLQQFVDGVEPGTAVGQLDVGQDQAGFLFFASATASVWVRATPIT